MGRGEGGIGLGTTLVMCQLVFSGISSSSSSFPKRVILNFLNVSNQLQPYLVCGVSKLALVAQRVLNRRALWEIGLGGYGGYFAHCLTLITP